MFLMLFFHARVTGSVNNLGLSHYGIFESFKLLEYLIFHFAFILSVLLPPICLVSSQHIGRILFVVDIHISVD